MRLRIAIREPKKWRWLERVALAVLGLAIILSITAAVITGTRRPASRAVISPPPPGNPPRQAASVPPVSPPEQPATAANQNVKPPVPVASVKQDAPAKPRRAAEPPAATGPHGFRLRGKGVVILAVTEEDAAELVRRPERLGDLIQSGSLFSVPSETPVEIAGTHDALTQVHVLDGPFQGRDGWVRASQIARK
jgi:hypothetical protein